MRLIRRRLRWRQCMKPAHGLRRAGKCRRRRARFPVALQAWRVQGGSFVKLKRRMQIRRLLSLILTLGILMLGAPAVAVSAPTHHHPPPADCAPDKTDKSSPACLQTCAARTACPAPPAPTAAASPPARTPLLPRPADDRIAGRSLGPEPPPPRG